jgi:hypothetical protein
VADPIETARAVLAIAGTEERIETELARALLAAEARADRLRAAADGACQAIEAIAAVERAHPAIGIIARDLRAALKEQP